MHFLSASAKIYLFVGKTAKTTAKCQISRHFEDTLPHSAKSIWHIAKTNAASCISDV